MRFGDLALWLLVGLLLIGWVRLYARQSALEASRGEPEPSTDVLADEPRPGNKAVTPPPIINVGDVTLREWPTRFRPKRDGVGDEVVKEFYARAAGDVRIASYFAHVGMAKLQQRFLATLLIVTGRGLAVSAVESMGDKRATVRDLDGNPISDEAYDRVVAALGQVIAEALVEVGVEHEPVLGQLLATVAPPRAAIVRPRVGEA